MPFAWPTELDDSQRLLGAIGSFWSEIYQGQDLVAALLAAKGQQHAQLHLDFLELLASISRFKVPLYHQRNWQPFKIRENSAGRRLATWNGRYDFVSGLTYDEPPQSRTFDWASPDKLAAVTVILNRILAPTRTYSRGLDFTLEDGFLSFRTNPFEDPDAAVEDLYDNGEIVDRELTLWLYAGEFDYLTAYKQFGYAISLQAKDSTPAYRAALNAVYDSLCEGTTVRCVEQFIAACCDIPLVAQDGTVAQIVDDGRHLWVITDVGAYAHQREAMPVVAVGDHVREGQTLTDALQFFEFNRGQTPDAVRATTLDRSLLTAGYLAGITFENNAVQVTVTVAPGDYTRLEFPVQGWPGDVEKFWQDVHARGIARGQTLAMLLDQRPADARTEQPTALVLPTTINPFAFLCQNVFRDCAFAAIAKPHLFGPDSLGFAPLRLLRRLVPPHVLALLFVYLSGQDADVIMDGATDAPGSVETGTTFAGTLTLEDVDPSVYSTEAGRCYSVAGECH